MPTRTTPAGGHCERPTPPALTETDRRTAARVSALLRRGLDARARISVSSEVGGQTDLPLALMRVLESAAAMVAAGTHVAVMPRDADLTSQQGADLLNVSRQYLVRLLDRGDIPSTKVGAHRRVRAADLALYRERRDAGRAAALAAMADQAQADGAYDAPAAFGPTRKG